VLVLVHGWTNNRTFWEPHTATLSEEFQVVTLDLAGFGESGMNRSNWSMEAFGRDVVAVVEALELEQVFLVGFSMGGAAVLEAADVLGDRVSGVVIVDVFHNVHEQYDDAAIDAFVSREQELWHDAAYLQEDFTPDAPPSFAQRYIDNTPPVAPDHWWEIIRNYFAWRNTDLPGAIQAVRAPISAINGEYTRTAVDTFRLHAPSFEVSTMPEVGHLGVIWMKTDLFDQLLTDAVARMSKLN
jgi:pimeloyl-ACP methyl ester carboxylesterase